MATKYFCDRCGKEQPAGKTMFRVVALHVPLGTYTEVDLRTAMSGLDLCEACKDSIMRDANAPVPQMG